jgi:hypothetical protein
MEEKETKKFNIKLLITVIISLVVITTILAFLQRLVEPKYMDNSGEGSLIEEYYDNIEDHQIIIVGDCEVYENLVPPVLWEDYGYTSYIRGSAQQLIWQSYYLLEETYKYENPDVVIFNVLSMQYNEPQKEAYNRMTLDGMKWSSSKVGAIKASMMEDEQMIDYVFPILRYHSRITELKKDDITYFFDKPTVADNGYYMQVGIVPADYVPEGKPLGDYTFGDNAYYYLDAIREICEEHGSKLILVKAPSLYPKWHDEWDAQMEDYAAKYNLDYINFLEHTDEIGLDYNVDTYDAGLHLNVYGAEKLTRYLGEYLKENTDLQDLRSNEDVAEEYNQKLLEYRERLAKKEEERDAGK